MRRGSFAAPGSEDDGMDRGSLKGSGRDGEGVCGKHYVHGFSGKLRSRVSWGKRSAPEW